MPHNHEWQSRIKSVEREYAAMRQAADRFRQAARDDSNILGHSNVLRAKVEYRDIVEASRSLEATYVIRLFAEFESGLRQYWSTVRPSRPQAADLISGLAARRGIPDTQRDNALVHEREENSEPLAISKARHYLCHFFSFLSEQW